jgi:hypothetical protein
LSSAWLNASAEPHTNTRIAAKQKDRPLGGRFVCGE